MTKLYIDYILYNMYALTLHVMTCIFDTLMLSIIIILAVKMYIFNWSNINYLNWQNNFQNLPKTSFIAKDSWQWKLICATKFLMIKKNKTMTEMCVNMGGTFKSWVWPTEIVRYVQNTYVTWILIGYLVLHIMLCVQQHPGIYSLFWSGDT